MTKEETAYCRVKLNKTTLEYLTNMVNTNNIVWLISRRDLLKLRRKMK